MNEISRKARFCKIRCMMQLSVTVVFVVSLQLLWSNGAVLFLMAKDRITKTDSQKQKAMPNIYSPRRNPLPLCTTPRHHLVYIKVQKTGGTTLCSYILEPYGYERNLSFVVSYKGMHHLGYPYHFIQSHVLPPLKNHNDFFTQEARYNLKILQKLMPNDTVYIFSFRKPIERFLSSFYYTSSPKLISKLFNIHDAKLILKVFLSDPENMLKVMLENYRSINIIKYDEVLNAFILPSSQTFSMGLDNANSMEDIHEVAKQIVSEFETFVLTEYFDESMVLLKRTMCWDLEDVLYNKFLNKRQPNPNQLTANTLPGDLRAKILEYNRADVIFYEYANQTFWEKIRQEKHFYEELDEYRKMNEEFSEHCAKKNKTVFKKKCAYSIYIRRLIYEKQKKNGIPRLMKELHNKVQKMKNE